MTKRSVKSELSPTVIKQMLSAFAMLFVSVVLFIVSIFVDRPASVVLIILGLVLLAGFFIVAVRSGKQIEEDAKAVVRGTAMEEHPTASQTHKKVTSSTEAPPASSDGFEEGDIWIQWDKESKIVEKTWQLKDMYWMPFKDEESPVVSNIYVTGITEDNVEEKTQEALDRIANQKIENI